MDLGWILHGFVQIWAWIWEITYQLTLLEWRLAWYWAIYLAWAGFPNQFLRNSISKRGKFIDLRSKLRSFSAFSRSFNRSKIGFMFTPVFCNASRNRAIGHLIWFVQTRKVSRFQVWKESRYIAIIAAEKFLEITLFDHITNKFLVAYNDYW